MNLNCVYKHNKLNRQLIDSRRSPGFAPNQIPLRKGCRGAEWIVNTWLAKMKHLERKKKLNSNKTLRLTNVQEKFR